MRAPRAALAALQWFRRRRVTLFRWAHVIVPGAVLLAMVGLRLSGLDWVEWVQLKAFDAFQVRHPRPYEDAGVRIIDIDDESLAKLGQWPWPRTMMARLITRLADLGAASIGLDMVFPEPDRTSPRRVAGQLPSGPGLADLRRRLEDLPDHDVVFARALARAPVALGFAPTHLKNGVWPAEKMKYVPLGADPRLFVNDYPGAVANLPILEKAAKGNGSFGFIPDPDGMIRRPPLLMQLSGKLYPSLSLEAFRVALGETSVKIKSTYIRKSTSAIESSSAEKAYGDEATGISKIKIGDQIVPTDAEGRVWVHFTDIESSKKRVIPVWRLFENNFPRDEIEGRILFLGTSAAGLKDLRATPLNSAAAGVEVHANVVEQIVQGNFLRMPDWAPFVVLAYMAGWGILLITLLPLAGAALCFPIALAGVAAAVFLSWKAFIGHRYLIDPVFPALTAFLIYVVSSLVSYLKSESERKQVKGAFSRYMSPALVEQLAKHPEKLQLGGEMREMTFHFCDIRGFTTISEQFEPKDLTHFINQFLTPMTEILLAHKGVIDKYMGDCIMAFWNAPLDDAEHATNACRAALAMHERLAALNAAWKTEAEAAGRKYIPIHIGTGLNTGPCVVGNMGSEMRFDYSVLGDAVNLASRLEGQSKTYGVNIVVGSGTREKAGEFATLELDLIRVKGKTKPVHIYTLLGDSELKKSETFQKLHELHGRMLAGYRSQKWDEARALVKECRAVSGVSLGVLYDLYANRILEYMDQPPGGDWDGVYTAKTK